MNAHNILRFPRSDAWDVDDMMQLTGRGRDDCRRICRCYGFRVGQGRKGKLGIDKQVLDMVMKMPWKFENVAEGRKFLEEIMTRPKGR